MYIHEKTTLVINSSEMLENSTNMGTLLLIAAARVSFAREDGREETNSRC